MKKSKFLVRIRALVGLLSLSLPLVQLASVKPVSADTVVAVTLDARCETSVFSSGGNSSIFVKFSVDDDDFLAFALLKRAWWRPAFYFSGPNVAAGGATGVVLPERFADAGLFPNAIITDSADYPATNNLYATSAAVGGASASGTLYDVGEINLQTNFDAALFDAQSGNLIPTNYSRNIQCDLLGDPFQPEPKDNDKDGDYFDGIECYGEDSFPFDDDPANGCHFKPPNN